MARKKSFDTAIDFPFRLVVRPLVSQTRVPKAPLSLPLSLSLPARTPPGIQKRRRAILYTWELYTKISSFARDIREARVQPGGKLTSAHKNRFDILPLRRPYSETKLDSGGSERERERERERGPGLVHVRLQINARRADPATRAFSAHVQHAFPFTWLVAFHSPVQTRANLLTNPCSPIQGVLPVVQPIIITKWWLLVVKIRKFDAPCNSIVFHFYL